MRRGATGWLLVLAVAWCGRAAAQAPAPGPTPATVVQLPTFSYFAVSTSVLVPDRGSAHLGGIGRASSGASQYGVPGLGKLPFAGRPFTNRAIGSHVGASNMHVSATIHDFEAMDQALLNQRTPYSTHASRQPPPGQAAAMGHVLLPRQPGGATGWPLLPEPSSALPSVEEARARRADEQVARGSEAEDFFARGERAEAEGKANVARIYYEMAARRATGAMQELVAARLEALRSEGASRVAQSRP